MLNENTWGLGLTYNLMGRIYFKEAGNYEVAKEFFGKAMVNFTLCQHYRGMYMTEEAIMDVAIKEKT